MRANRVLSPHEEELYRQSIVKMNLLTSDEGDATEHDDRTCLYHCYLRAVGAEIQNSKKFKKFKKKVIYQQTE